jgi:threonine synthase
MRYRSTRGEAPDLDFREATLAGLASDGGLYVPDRWPTFTANQFSALRTASYIDTAAAVLQPFVGGSLSDAALHRLVTDAYGDFGHAAVTPLTQLDERHWLLELFHGPTMAFKDVALRLLGGLFGQFLGDGEQLTIIGATSGDTGSAAIHAVAERPGIRIVMLHPHGRVSDVQRRQMTTVAADNVFNLAVEGSFDDCQRIVKQLLNDPALLEGRRLSAVNSINWARLAAQIVYYVTAAVRLGAPERPVSFAVPTGNFGDVFAGYVAWRMGLPIGRLVVATNVNDILARALNQGDYSVGMVAPTDTPSMDIQVSSNFERLLFDLSDRDADRLTALMREFEKTGRMVLPEPMRAEAATIFTAHRTEPSAMAQAMGWANQGAGQIIDPHTAVGLAAARAAADAIDGPVVTLATAHLAKFPDAVARITGQRPALPASQQSLFERPERYQRIAADPDAIRGFVAEVA